MLTLTFISMVLLLVMHKGKFLEDCTLREKTGIKKREKECASLSKLIVVAAVIQDCGQFTYVAKLTYTEPLKLLI